MSWPKPVGICWRPCEARSPRTGLDDYSAGRALADHGRQTTVPQPGHRTPAADQIFYTADFTEPDRWWIAGTDGKPPRESSRCERARVASLAVHNAIRAARPAPAAARDDAPAANASPAAHTDDHHHDQMSDAPHGVDHPGRDAALSPARRASAVQAHQQPGSSCSAGDCPTAGPTGHRTAALPICGATVRRGDRQSAGQTVPRQPPVSAPRDSMNSLKRFRSPVA
jgi:hypothetical protein